MSGHAMEFWLDFGSNYSYVAASRVQLLAAEAGVTIVWRPFLLGPVFKRFGWETSPFVLQKEKGEYAFMDTARECAKYGVPWLKPTRFPRTALQTMRVAAAFAEAGWVAEYCRRVMALNFAADEDIDSPEVAMRVLDTLGEDGPAIVEAAQAPERKARLRAFGEEAVRRKVFGAPTFFVGDEMFWGNDRLEDALERAREKSSTACPHRDSPGRHR